MGNNVVVEVRLTINTKKKPDVQGRISKQQKAQLYHFNAHSELSTTIEEKHTQ